MIRARTHPTAAVSPARANARHRRARAPIATLLSLAALGLAGAAPAAADAPLPSEVSPVLITSPTDGSTSNITSPLVTGTTSEEFEAVTVRIFEATGGLPGAEVGPPLTAISQGFSWSAGPPANPLPDGTYIARAEEPPHLLHENFSPLVTFTVDTTPPAPTITSPANGSTATGGSEPVAGTAGTAPGDLATVTVRLWAGGTAGSGASVESLVLASEPDGHWSGTFGGLAPGTYTAQAEQLDNANNHGTSAAVTFTMSAPPPPPTDPPPTASFSWFPVEPQVGESVSFVSSSGDSASPIASFAWAIGNGDFHGGGPVLTTSFTGAGSQVVRLRVTAADGMSSVVSRTVTVTSPPLTLMLPFPIVSIAGTETRSGVRISLLAAQAPVGSRVTVNCHGRGCPSALQSSIATVHRHGKAAPSGSVEIVFRRFERALRAGIVLEVRVAAPGEIGKYTRFLIRRNRVPLRQDSCVAALEPGPIPCAA